MRATGRAGEVVAWSSKGSGGRLRRDYIEDGLSLWLITFEGLSVDDGLDQ